MAIRRDDPLFPGSSNLQPASDLFEGTGNILRADQVFSGGIGLAPPTILFGTDSSPGEVDPVITFDSGVVTFDNLNISWDET